MTSFPKTIYWRTLVINAESVDKTTNTSFFKSRVPPIVENEEDFVLVKHIFQCASASLCSQQLTKISRSL